MRYFCTFLRVFWGPTTTREGGFCLLWRTGFSQQQHFARCRPPDGRLDISVFFEVKTYPYTDISDLERRELYREDRDTITDRDGMAEALNLSPNRVSELTIRAS